MKTINNLLLIDDDEISIFLAKKAVEKTNRVAAIQVFENGLDAINFLKENANHALLLPEIILLDISMPIMDGWQFLEHFERLMPFLRKDIEIYICSSSISPSDVFLAKSNPIVLDYILKPITKEKIIDIIGNRVVKE